MVSFFCDQFLFQHSKEDSGKRKENFQVLPQLLVLYFCRREDLTVLCEVPSEIHGIFWNSFLGNCVVDETLECEVKSIGCEDIFIKEIGSLNTLKAESLHRGMAEKRILKSFSVGI
jgi:hypothetical protein